MKNSVGTKKRSSLRLAMGFKSRAHHHRRTFSLESPRIKKLVLAFLFAVFCGVDLLAQELPTVSSVDLNRYAGVWYEITSIPQFFQRKCVKNTTANYQLTSEGLVQVINQCIEQDGSLNEAQGRARIEDKTTQSKLRVTFVNLFGSWIFAFGGDYWIVDLDPAYQWVVVGHPSRKYGWILSRKPELEKSLLQSLEARLRGWNYDTCLWQMALQEGGNSIKAPLCQAIQ